MCPTNPNSNRATLPVGKIVMRFYLCHGRSHMLSKFEVDYFKYGKWWICDVCDHFTKKGWAQAYQTKVFDNILSIPHCDL
jgi:hypothetical protein